MENVGTVLISGGTGLIGRYLAPILRARGWRLHLLSRSGKSVSGWDAVFRWNPENGWIDQAALEGVSHVIHLAGESIAGKRWTRRRKEQIVSSRVDSAVLLFETFKKVGQKPEVFISASGVGWYGMLTDNKLHTEDEPAAADFMGQTCKLWEEAADRFAGLGCRVVKLRTGIVLARDGGALPVMSLPVKLFAGCILGSGKQQVPWIHIEDLCRLYTEALAEPKLAGRLQCGSDRGVHTSGIYAGTGQGASSPPMAFSDSGMDTPAGPRGNGGYCNRGEQGFEQEDSESIPFRKE
jgi:uncharacterized protein